MLRYYNINIVILFTFPFKANILFLSPSEQGLTRAYLCGIISQSNIGRSQVNITTTCKHTKETQSFIVIVDKLTIQDSRVYQKMSIILIIPLNSLKLIFRVTIAVMLQTISVILFNIRNLEDTTKSDFFYIMLYGG